MSAQLSKIALGSYVLVPPGAASTLSPMTGSAFERVHEVEARRVLRRAFEVPALRRALYALYRAGGATSRPGPPTTRDYAAALQWLLSTFDRRVLGAVMFRRAAPRVSGDLTFDLPSDRPTFEAIAKHYVDLLMVDQRGEPVPGGAYTIELPDGVTRSGRMGALGAAYFTTTAGGSAHYTMPASELAEETGDVIQLALHTPDGRPASHVAFELKGSDGTIVRGTTDEMGRAIASGLPAGPAELSFPDLDESAWQRGTPPESGESA